MVLNAARAEVYVLVVENDYEPHSKHTVNSFRDRLEIHYALEREPGIPFARNRGIKVALEYGFDWLIFIDDDEFVNEDWLDVLLSAPDRFDAEVFTGPRIRIYPEEAMPEWFPYEVVETRYPTGSHLTVTYTANTMVARRIFAPVSSGGMDLRFNEKLRYTGGSDREFFSRLTQEGGRIVWIDEAILSEEVPAERATLKWNLGRSKRIYNNRVLFERSEGGLGQACRYAAPKFLRLPFLAVVHAVSALLRFFTDKNSAKASLFISGVRLASFHGILLGLLGIACEPYRKVEGE